MKKNELIKRMKETTSVVDFYELKDEMFRHLGVVDTEKRIARKRELQSMKMQELRKVGNALGVSDTSKPELVEEILFKEGL